MKIAFYIGGETFIDKAIQWWDQERESHCELIFSDGVSFSSRPKGWGTSFKAQGKIDYSDSSKWEVIDLSEFIDSDAEEIIRKWCVAEDDCWYDIIGIFFSVVFPFGFQNPWWWFCSEVCCAALQQIGWFVDEKSWKITPSELHKITNIEISRLKYFRDGRSESLYK